MPASNGARENGERGKKNRGKEKARLYELSNTSSASLSEGDLHGFSRDLKRLAKICRVLMPGEQLDAAEMALQPQLDREAEIETLKNSLEVMREERQRDKDVRDGKEQELENMRKEIDKKTKQLQCEKAAGESKREEYQKKMADKQEKSWNKEKESLTQQKKQEVSALQTRLKKLEDSNNILEKEKTILRQDLRDTTEKLKSEAMARRGIEILVDQLNQRQENLMSDVGVTSKPAEDYNRRFRELSGAIQQAAMDRFSTLPEGLEDYGSFKMTLRKLESSSDIFKYTPADSGVIPDFLRRCGIEHFIARRICLFINKPFVDGCTPELEGGAGLLDTIRRQISERSTRCEDIWMALTARAMEPKVNKDILRKKMVQEILCELRGVTDPRNSEQLQRDLVSIVDTAIALWSDLRSDSCRLDFDFEPDLANDNTAWFIQETPPCEIGWGNSNDGRDATLNFTERFQSFALFPRIVITRENGQDPIFKAGDDSNLTSGAGNEEPEKEVVYPGRALFDSSAFIEGARQREELENLYREQMKEFARKRKTSSLTSPVIDKGSTLRSDKQIHQEGEESPLNIKTDE